MIVMNFGRFRLRIFFTGFILLGFLSLDLISCPGSGPDQGDSLITGKLKSFRNALSANSPEADDYYYYFIDFLDNYQGTDSLLISECYYFTGTYKYLRKAYTEAINLLEKSLTFRSSMPVKDDLYVRAMTNMGLSYYYSGSGDQAMERLEEALRIREELFGPRAVELVRSLLNLSAVYVNMNMYERALDTALRGISISEEHLDKISYEQLAKLHYNTALSYMNMMDYIRSFQQVNIANSMIRKAEKSDIDFTLTVLNLLAVSNAKLGYIIKAESYYLTAVEIIDSLNYNFDIVYYIYSNYAFLLSNIGLNTQAELYLKKAIGLAENKFGYLNRTHVSQLLNYSYYLLTYREDLLHAGQILNQVSDYIHTNRSDDHVKVDYYLQLSDLYHKSGNFDSAIENLNIILGDSILISSKRKTSAYIFKTKILSELYSRNRDISKLEEALSSIESAIHLIESTRLNINEEESRARFSGIFDNAYEVAIKVMYDLYEHTGEKKYIELAFAVSEKSKAAALLSATRNNRAMSYHLPPALSGLEKNLISDIRDYNEVIYKESSEPEPDRDLMEKYQALIFSATTRHDSLVRVFERDYPRYYNLRHNTSVSSAGDILNHIGHGSNFLEYFMTENSLYIFLLNSDTLLLKSVETGDELRNDILKLRDNLLNPVILNGARQQYNDFTVLAYRLYQKLIEPVHDCFISDRLVISSNGLIAYVPFETLLSNLPQHSETNYRDLDYLLKKYEIVYEYSGTLLSELGHSRRSLRNSVISFAPFYKDNIDVESVMSSRQNYRDSLTNIPGAREEAIFINKLLGGSLFIDEQATENTFKTNAGDGDIIHLALHTMLNDREPMYSRMVFSPENDTLEDGLLNTYEIYNLPVESKMLFLSSCNTGSGYLQSGEGIMSLARGFFYSGSNSVVMSMWEVDDITGSEIVKVFYRKLKKGYTKSRALREARLEYLDNTDQMRSHPYFWSTLVIMGNNDALYLHGGYSLFRQ